MSRSESLTAAVEARLKTIRTGATVTVKGRTYTYRTDVGLRYVLRRLTPLSESEPHLLNLIPGVPQRQTELAEFGLDRYRIVFGIALQARGGANTAGREAATLVSLGIEDIMQAVASDRRWGGLARYSEVAVSGPDGEMQEQLLAQKIYAAELTLGIEYTVNAGEV